MSATPYRHALRGYCPHCGEGALFTQLLNTVERCAVCDTEFGKEIAGDGPAFFVIVILGTLATVGAVLVDMAYRPPLWVHAAIWIPAITVSGLLLLRVLKAWLIAAHFRHGIEGSDADD